MVLDHARVEPNPARDRLTVKLPREERRHVEPPTADHVEGVVHLLPHRYRLPVLVLDATGERLRTALTRACTASGVPAFSPHDVRHRRVSLLHLGGMPWARIGELVGHEDRKSTRLNSSHVEISYAVFCLKKKKKTKSSFLFIKKKKIIKIKI